MARTLADNPYAARALGISSSLTVSITGRAAALARAGADIISMSAGEPDFDTPEHVREAAVRAIRAGHTKYASPASGLTELKEAACAKFRRDNGLGYDPDQIVVTSGAKQLIFDGLIALLDEGDEVLLPAPLYVSTAEQVKLAGGTPVLLPTEPDAFCLRPEQIDEALTARTKLLVLNSPCNPTGAVYPPDLLQDLAGRVAEAGLYVISDEIYEKFTYDGASHASIAALHPELPERTLVVNGVSKAYAMTGWRVGFGAGPKAWMDLIGKIQSQETTCACTISQHAATEALNGPQDSVETMRAAFAERRERIAARLAALPGIRCVAPPGAFYVFPDVRGLCERTGGRIPDDVAFCEYLLDEAGVAAVPGSGFSAPGYVRFSYTLPADRIEAAAARIGRAVNALLGSRRSAP